MPSALLCEDDRAIRSLVEHALRREGYVVDSAADGGDAILLLRDREFDVVILDLMMPVMSGDAVLRHVMAERPELLPRIIVATAAVNRARELSTPSVGAVVTKPFDLHEFLSVIHLISRQGKDA